MKLWTCILLFAAVVTSKAYTGDNMDGMLFMRTSEREQLGCSRVGMYFKKIAISLYINSLQKAVVFKYFFVTSFLNLFH